MIFFIPQTPSNFSVANSLFVRGLNQHLTTTMTRIASISSRVWPSEVAEGVIPNELRLADACQLREDKETEKVIKTILYQVFHPFP